MVEEGSLFAKASDAYWIDAGTPSTYLRAQLDLLSGCRSGVPAPDATEGEPGVWTIGGPVVSGSVVPRSLIGDAAFVGKESHVEGSVVSAGARVEGARVVGSVLLPGAVARAGALVEGSIVGAGAVVGEGAEVTQLSVVGEGVELAGDARLVGARVPGS